MPRHHHHCGCYDCHIARARRERWLFWTIVVGGALGIGALLWFNLRLPVI